MPRFTRVASILGLDREVPDVGDVFVRDAKEQREAEAEARRVEFERFSESTSGRRQEEQSTSHLPVRQDRLSIVAQALNNGRAPGEPLGLDAYHMSSQSVKRAGIEAEHESNFGAAQDPTMLGSMHMFQSREAWEKQFEDLKEQDDQRREARKTKATRDERRQGVWEGSVAERVAELMSQSPGMASDVMMNDGNQMTAADMRGGSVRAIGGIQIANNNFGVVDYDAAERRDDSVVDMRQARVDRQKAISRAKDEHQQSVNEDLASKMRSSSVQQQSIDGGGLAMRVAAALQRKAAQ